MIYLITKPATDTQTEEMLETFGSYIKVAVDIERGILAGGGELHADCEKVLLEYGCQQVNIWGANWYPTSQRIEHESLINIRPCQNNRSMIIQDPLIRDSVARIIKGLLANK